MILTCISNQLDFKAGTNGFISRISDGRTQVAKVKINKAADTKTIPAKEEKATEGPPSFADRRSAKLESPDGGTKFSGGASFAA